MRTNRFTPRPLADAETEPFPSAEEAWLWYARCQTARDDGVRFVAGLAEVPRPCEPDDIIREVRRLYRQRRLRSGHLKVLIRLGGLMETAGEGAPSDRAAQLWAEALDRLSTPLRRKGIVA